jgi:predicted phage terminase large subunit-like protein
MKSKNTSFSKETIDKVLTDHRVRQEVVGESHYWFFHTYFHHYITYKTADFQRKIFQLTEKEKIRNLVIIAFRGSGKSTIINLSYPLWSILGKQQKKFVLLVGQTQHQARQHLKNIKRELESNDLLRKDLGPFKEDDDWSSSSLLIPKHDARIMAVSMEQSVRGIRHNQYRPDLIICDDIENTSSVKTREGRNKTYDWLTSEVIPAGDKNTRLVMIGNLLHEDSVIMRMKEKIKKKEMSGVWKAYPIVRNSKPLWSGKFSDKKSIKEEKQRVANYISWMREYELKIVPDDGQIVLSEDIHYYDHLPEENHCEDDDNGIYFRFAAIGTDVAIGQKKSADYTAFVPMKVFKVGKKKIIYILPHIINARFDFSGSKENLKALAQTIHNHPKSVKLYTEEVGYQKVFTQEMKKDSYTTKPINIVGDKRSRLSAAHHYIKTGHVLFPRKGCEQLIQQIMGFGVEKHDDLVDALTIAVNEIMAQNEPRAFYCEIDNGPGLLGNILDMKF